MATHRGDRVFPLILVLVATLMGSMSSLTVQDARAQEDGKGVRTIYLIRHGAYDWEDERDPDVGKALTPLGIAQARLVSSRLRTLGVDFDVMYASTMTRARQTAEVIHQSFPDLEPQLTRDLRECTPRTWREDIMERTPEEEWSACEEQLTGAFARYFVPSPEQDRHEILVCHGNVTRWFVTQALMVAEQSWLQMSIYHCSLTVIKVLPDGRFKVISVGDIGHIPPELQSGIFVDRPLVPVE